MNNKEKLENDFIKSLMIEFLKPYFHSNKLSIDKLWEKDFKLLYDKAYFLEKSDVAPDGLKNDMQTLPKALLIIEYKNGRFEIYKNNLTEKYLNSSAE